MGLPEQQNLTTLCATGCGCTNLRFDNRLAAARIDVMRSLRPRDDCVFASTSEVLATNAQTEVVQIGVDRVPASASARVNANW